MSNSKDASCKTWLYKYMYILPKMTHTLNSISFDVLKHVTNKFITKKIFPLRFYMIGWWGYKRIQTLITIDKDIRIFLHHHYCASDRNIGISVLRYLNLRIWTYIKENEMKEIKGKWFNPHDLYRVDFISTCRHSNV